MLAAKPSGYVVFMWFDRDSVLLGPFGFFGGAPGQPLPDLGGLKVDGHAQTNAKGIKDERPGIRVVPLTR